MKHECVHSCWVSFTFSEKVLSHTPLKQPQFVPTSHLLCYNDVITFFPPGPDRHDLAQAGHRQGRKGVAGRLVVHRQEGAAHDGGLRAVPPVEESHRHLHEEDRG